MRRVGTAAFAFILACASTSRADDAVRPEQRAAVHQSSHQGSSAFSNALRLARMLYDDRTIAMLVAARGGAKNATDDEVAEAVDAYENIGDPDRAISLLTKRLERSPKNKRAREMLAELYERDGRSADAAAMWATLDSVVDPFALTIPQITSYARDLARAGKIEAAFAVLRAHAPGTADDATTFWIDFGTLAWLLEDQPLALQAYRKVWSLEPTTPNVGTRLMNLAKDEGFDEEAISVALAEYALSHEPTTLLFAANVQAERRDWAGVNRTLALAQADPAGFERREEYWMLRAEVASELGDEPGSILAWKKVLALRPNNSTAQAAVLWHDVDQDDVRAITRDVELFRPNARISEDLWAPFGVALQRIGRGREALEFILRAWRTHPEDESMTFELADALESAGAAEIAGRLRRHVMSQRQTSAQATVRSGTVTKEELGRLLEHVEYVREHAGVAMGERWLRATLASHSDESAVNELALTTYSSDERWELARKAMRHVKNVPLEAQMTLAIADGDYGATRRLLAMPALTSPRARAQGYELLERDADERGGLRDAWTNEPEADRLAGAQRLRELQARHAPNFKLGGGYAYVNGLQALAVEVGAAHDLGPLRVVYTARGGNISLTSGSPAIDTLSMAGPRTEAALGVLLRRVDTRGVTELGAGIDYQPDRPIPRATFFDERLFGRVLSTKLDLTLHDRIEDTPWLRLEGARSRGIVGVRVDYAKRLYTAVDVGAIEDHTRRFEHLGFGTEEIFESGVKILRGTPELDIGVEAEAVQRWNVDLRRVNNVTKSDITLKDADPINGCTNCLLPESYQVVAAVAHLARGDFADRYRADRRSFPRYDCDAGAGVIFPAHSALTTSAGTTATEKPLPWVHFSCALSFRIAGGGYLSGSGSYDRGVGGNDERNAHANLFFTQPL